ncbi:hypothetical protein BU26DRAFT_205872 [Trematosphaeria pertusa]|uniref:Uncharacterized protein n=1 Tax=Trematosphaeria pertusa TaxID=390896 RepID=A0A6A6HR09_9PLEO|nr:uncharacterized protein BU26DRAFT_205872 [Trematosphaeria pertusa]KAF2240461.1 hypothetical protein BU26DRAFT_205872 [Trematosphaeria pertusa]
MRSGQPFISRSFVYLAAPMAARKAARSPHRTTVPYAVSIYPSRRINFETSRLAAALRHGWARLTAIRLRFLLLHTSIRRGVLYALPVGCASRRTSPQGTKQARLSCLEILLQTQESNSFIHPLQPSWLSLCMPILSTSDNGRVPVLRRIRPGVGGCRP